MSKDKLEQITERVRNPIKFHREDPIRLDDRHELVHFAKEVGTSWHEPDEQDLTAWMLGRRFDNAGFWGSSQDMYSTTQEQHVVLAVGGDAVAAVNLATLFDWATQDSPAPKDRG